MDDVVVSVSEVSKTFKLPHEKHGSIKSVILNIFRAHRTYERQQALKNVSFEVKQGEFFGIIGRNGGGKSTLLKLLAGIYSPNSGAVTVNGKLTPFIELGVGFNPELTGRDNVYLNGALLGFSDKEVDTMYDDIVEFAELERFMDQKLKNYSSGMQVRLAFSIAIRAKSDILLIDEVLAVGDTNFQKKCIEVFEQLKRSGTTIIFVSHAMGYVRDFCDRVAVISKGELVFIGDTEQGVDIYNKLNYEEESARVAAANSKDKSGALRIGNGKAEIIKHRILNDAGKESIKLSSGKKFKVELDIAFHESVKKVSIGVMFRKSGGENLFGLNNTYEEVVIPPQPAGQTLRFTASSVMPLAPGTYNVSYYVADARSTSDYEEVEGLVDAKKVNVSGKQHWGMVSSDIKIETKIL